MFEKLNSPIEKLNLAPFNQLFVKRDDLIDPYISGNKWRKLKFLLAKAAAEKKNHLVTFGGAFSNHLVATAAAAARAKLKATAFVRGEEVQNEMLLLCKLWGMRLIFVDRIRYRDKRELFDQHFLNDEDAFFIDEGGASAEAVKGCAEIIDELDNHYQHIFCAAGTGTTAAGLLKGLQNFANTQLHVVPVLKDAGFIQPEIEKYTGKSNQLFIHLDYHFGGYAKVNTELITFIKYFVSQTGILVDPVYTAKMFFAIGDLQKKGIIQADDKILALHTGGLLGLMGMKNRF